MTGPEDGDYWTNLPGALAERRDGAPAPALTVETIGGVEPLDTQLGVVEPLTVPPALYEPLFGQPDVIEGRTILPLQTYAVLDAAKLPGLPEMLEASGLQHACLFQGTAAEELRDVAPYLIRLEEGHRFTRGLFTRGDAPWNMWGKEPGIFLRSRGTMDLVRSHLRRSVRTQDMEGRWHLFRIWEATTAGAYLSGLSDRTEWWSRWFVVRGVGSPCRIMIPEASRRERSAKLHVFGVDGSSGHLSALTPVGPLTISGADVARLSAARRERQLDKLADRLEETLPEAIGGLSTVEVDDLTRDVVARMQGLGFRRSSHLFVLLCWEAAFGPHFEEIDPEGDLVDILKASDHRDADARMSALIERMSVLEASGTARIADGAMHAPAERVGRADR